MSQPEIGDFGVIRTGGFAAWAIRFGTDSPFNHAFIYVGDGQIMEARPSGAGFADVPDGATWSSGIIPLTGQQRRDIDGLARACEGIEYGWLDIVAIALAQKRLGKVVDGDEWWVRRVNRSNTLICSQLVDLCYDFAGVHLFNDGRLPGLVSPGDLGRLILPEGG